MQEISFIQQLVVLLPPVLLAITVHEAAHGWAADKLGDKTARNAGRVTINPFRHIDPLGTVILPIIMYVTTGFLFGWAKPVPVNWRNLKSPRRDSALVAAAGPAVNLLMAIIWALILRFSLAIADTSLWVAAPLYHMANLGILINLVLMMLNLLPILPLDGGRVANAIMPLPMAAVYSRLEPWGLPILVVLMVTGLLWQVLGPLVNYGTYFISAIISLF